MTVQIAVRLSDSEVQRLDRSVERGVFLNRTEAIRAAVRLLLDDARAVEIEQAYRRSYGRDPQEEWVSRSGLAAFAAFAETEGAADGDL